MKKRILSVILTLTLCMGLSAPALAARTFSDVPATYWAHDAIQYVVWMKACSRALAPLPSSRGSA